VNLTLGLIERMDLISEIVSEGKDSSRNEQAMSYYKIYSFDDGFIDSVLNSILNSILKV
jgi:hypothetical protein